jgi:hypothetical protein
MGNYDPEIELVIKNKIIFMRYGFNYTILLLLTGLITSYQPVHCQSARGQLESMTGQKISSSSSASSTNMNNMVIGAIFKSMLTSKSGANSGNNQKEIEAQKRAADLAAQQAAEQQRINEAIAQSEYDKMMQSYKLLDGSQELKPKTLNSTNLDFKTLDGNAESLAAGAKNQFEVTGTASVSGSSVTGNATPFFGDEMPVQDLQTLLDPENNPNIVDLRDAKKFVTEKTVNDSSGIVSLLKNYEPEGNGGPIIQKPDCIKLENQLKGFANQRQQFRKTIDLSQNELNKWETANHNALINAAKDGLEYFTGELLEGLSNRGKAADRLQQIYDKNVKQMAGEGINVAGIKAKIDQLRSISSAGQIAELTANINDWETFLKDGMSSLIGRLTVSNTEIKGILEDSKMKKYFETEEPELNTLLDISKIAASNMIFGKWVTKKLPVIAVIELSIKQTYNGLDYFLSLNRIISAQKINGGVMDVARYIQKNIDDTYLALSKCH